MDTNPQPPRVSRYSERCRSNRPDARRGTLDIAFQCWLLDRAAGLFRYGYFLGQESQREATEVPQP